MRRVSLRGLLLAVWLAFVGVGAARAGEPMTEIDVTINIYKGSGTTKEKAKEAVKKASEILKKAGIKLNVSDARINENVTAGDDGSGGGTAEDGEFTRDERDKIREEGGKAVDNGNKGMKISFGKTPTADRPNNPGVSVHKDPTVIVKDRNDAEKTGETIAHEILHALTLAEEHKIDDATQSNDHGHAPDKAGGSGNGNAMAPSNRRTGSNITDDQKQKVDDDGYKDKWGKTVKKEEGKAPGQPKQQQKGAGRDDLGDAGTAPKHYDLTGADQRGTPADLIAGTKGFLTGTIGLGGLFPETGPVNANYGVLFEMDGAHAGFDQLISLNVNGDQSIAPLNITGQVTDLRPGGGTVPLPNVGIASAIEALDIDAPAVPAMNLLEYEVDQDLLGIDGLLAPVPVEVFSDRGSGPVDTLQFDLELDWWMQQPEMVMTQGQAMPGENVSFDILGLTPASPFDFFFDEQLLFSDVTDALGGFSGNIPLPPASEGNLYFLTAIDADGGAAFNVIEALPEPTTLALLGFGALLAARRRRRRGGRI
jgi:hypothetical protein